MKRLVAVAMLVVVVSSAPASEFSWGDDQPPRAVQVAATLDWGGVQKLIEPVAIVTPEPGWIVWRSLPPSWVSMPRRTSAMSARETVVAMHTAHADVQRAVTQAAAEQATAIGHARGGTRMSYSASFSYGSYGESACGSGGRRAGKGDGGIIRRILGRVFRGRAGGRMAARGGG